jgi:hypothetical protein
MTEMSIMPENQGARCAERYGEIHNPILPVAEYPMNTRGSIRFLWPLLLGGLMAGCARLNLPFAQSNPSTPGTVVGYVGGPKKTLQKTSENTWLDSQLAEATLYAPTGVKGKWEEIATVDADESNRFVFQNVKPGSRYKVLAGYGVSTTLFNGESAVFSVSAGKTTDVGNIKLGK